MSRDEGDPWDPELWRDAVYGKRRAALTTTSGAGQGQLWQVEMAPGAEKTHCAGRGHWYSCGCPGRHPGTPHRHCGVQGPSTLGSASGCSQAHRLTTYSMSPSSHPLDKTDTGRK